MAEFNLKEAFREAFGYEAPQNFSIEKAGARKEFSSLGQSYFSEVNDDVFGREFFLPVKINGYLIPFAVMSMNWKKTFVNTAMPERGGSVHEQISIDDYAFNIKGLLVDENGDFPEQPIIDLHKLFLINGNVRLESALSAIVLKSDPYVIIKEVKWPATAGVEHIRAFEIDCESDQIFELELQ